MNKTTRSGKVTADDMRKQEKLLAEKKALLDELEEMSHTQDQVQRMTAQKLLDQHTPLFQEANSRLEKFKEEFELKDGYYQRRAIA